MITGRVCALDPAHVRAEGGETRLTDVPMWDSPVLIADYAALDLAAARETTASAAGTATRRTKTSAPAVPSATAAHGTAK